MSSTEYQKVIFFRLPDSAASEEREFVSRMLGLKQVPGVTAIRVGNFGSGSASHYTHALLVRFASAEALEGYAPHPAHQHLGELVTRLGVEALAFNYPVDPAQEWLANDPAAVEPA